MHGPTEPALETNTLAERLHTVLKPLFTGDPLFVSDSQELVSWLCDAGVASVVYDAERLHSLAGSSELENVVAVFTTREGLPPNREWSEIFKKSRVLQVPLLSFDPRLEASMYTIDRIARSDYSKGVELNRGWLHLLGTKLEPMEFKGTGTDFVCGIDDEANLIAPKIDADLEPGEWVSIGSYLETAMVSQPDDIVPSFDVNGTFSVPGVAMAYHRQASDALVPLMEEAWQFFEALRLDGRFPIMLEVAGSRVVRATAGGKSILSDLLYFSNPRWELLLTEMAFGTNVGFAASEINWNYNSQLNEGPLGIHIAVGEGLTGAHIDFVCPGVSLQN